MKTPFIKICDCLVVAVAASLGGQAQAAPGDLDTTFNGTGLVTTDFGPYESYGNDVAVQADGKIVVVGSEGSYGRSSGFDFAVARYNPDGTLDSTFGGGTGKVTTGFGYEDFGRSVAIQADGKIVVAGYADSSSSAHNFGLVRYNPDGSVDPTFGGGTGEATADLGGNDLAESVAFQADGKIVVSGMSTATNNGSYGFGLARFNTDGSLDTTFGGGTGKVITDFGPNFDPGNSVAVQADGRIVVAGSTGDDFALARYNTDGSLDPTFGGGTGTVTTNLGGTDHGCDMALQPDGKIVVSGGADNDFAVVRYNTDGSLDLTFGGGTGAVITDFGYDDQSFDVALQPDGKIVAVGIGGGSFEVARFNPDGSLDPSFGGGSGKVRTNFGNSVDYAWGVAVQSDGKIVAVGQSYSYSTGRYRFAVARYEGTVPDTTPPVIASVTATPDSLWPASNKLVPITVFVSASDDSGVAPTSEIIDVSCNEPMASGDVVNTGVLTPTLRATRSGKGSGRVYTITVRCTDAAGNYSDDTVTVTVPHDQRKK